MAQVGMESAVRNLMTQIGRGQYEEAVRSCSASRLTADDLREVIGTYRRKLVELPDHVYERLDVIGIIDSNPPAWSVVVPLWSEEEGLSDLMLELTVINDGKRWHVELDDLRVP